MLTFVNSIRAAPFVRQKDRISVESTSDRASARDTWAISERGTKCGVRREARNADLDFAATGAGPPLIAALARSGIPHNTAPAGDPLAGSCARCHLNRRRSQKSPCC